MVWFLALMLAATYFLGAYWFQLAGVVALMALFATVLVVALGMRGMEKHEL